MSPLRCYHATHRKCRTSIIRDGLVPSRPRSVLQPIGVFVFTDGDDFNHPTWGTTELKRWTHQWPYDLWEVSYIGPLAYDCFVTNGLVLLEGATIVTLVTVTSNG